MNVRETVRRHCVYFSALLQTLVQFYDVFVIGENNNETMLDDIYF